MCMCDDGASISSSLFNIHAYYIDRCEFWGFIREINSGVCTCENIFFSRRNYFYITVSVVVTSLVVLQ